MRSSGRRNREKLRRDIEGLLREGPGIMGRLMICQDLENLESNLDFTAPTLDASTLWALVCRHTLGN